MAYNLDFLILYMIQLRRNQKTPFDNDNNTHKG